MRYIPCRGLLGPQADRAARAPAEDDFSDSPPPSDGDLSDSGSLDSSFSGGVRLTARQRAKEMGGPNGMELQSLPNLKGGAKPTVKLTEAEVALRRSENRSEERL